MSALVLGAIVVAAIVMVGGALLILAFAYIEGRG